MLPAELRWITVTQENGTRYLYLDGCEEGAMALDSEAPVFHYLWFHKLSHLIGLPLRRALVLGAGAFTAAKCLAIDYPDAVIDAVDEEPELEAIARRFFRLDQPQFGRIRFHPVPAEEFLAGPAGPYEFIFDDLFDGDQHVPIAGRGEDHVARLRSVLANGVCVKNLIWSPRSADSRAACRSHRGLQTRLPSASRPYARQPGRWPQRVGNWTNDFVRIRLGPGEMLTAGGGRAGHGAGERCGRRSGGS